MIDKRLNFDLVCIVILNFFFLMRNWFFAPSVDAQNLTWPVHFFQLTWIQGSKMESNFTLTNLSVLTSQEHHEFNLHLHSVSAEQWIIFGIAMPTFVGLSLVFNGLIFVVLLKDKIESSLHLLLHCLSCYDIGVALFSFWIYSWPTICLQFK